MTIRTDAINIYVKAYKKLCSMNGYDLKTYSLGGNNVGIGFESDGIKFVFAKATDNRLTQCPFANNENWILGMEFLLHTNFTIRYNLFIVNK